MAINIAYHKPMFHRRCFANLVDFILFGFMFALLFLGARAIVTNSSTYIEADSALVQIRGDSGLYFVSSDKKETTDIVSYLQNNNYDGYAKWNLSRKAIDTFIAYCGSNGYEGSQAKVQADYDAYRLDSRLTYKDIPMFIKEESGVIIENPKWVEACNLSTRFETAYAPYIDAKCQAFLVTEIPQYLDLTRYESNMLYFAELTPSYAVAGILVYFVPTLFFRRGRMTLGKAMYRIGLVDKRILVPKFGRSAARFGIFYVFELLLTPFTFGLPFLLSFSLMAFSKGKQGLPDYILGLNEVDVSDAKIYFDKVEIALEEITENKRPVDFKMEKYE